MGVGGGSLGRLKSQYEDGAFGKILQILYPLCRAPQSCSPRGKRCLSCSKDLT